MGQNVCSEAQTHAVVGHDLIGCLFMCLNLFFFPSIFTVLFVASSCVFHTVTGILKVVCFELLKYCDPQISYTNKDRLTGFLRLECTGTLGLTG